MIDLKSLRLNQKTLSVIIVVALFGWFLWISFTMIHALEVMAQVKASIKKVEETVPPSISEDLKRIETKADARAKAEDEWAKAQEKYNEARLKHDDDVIRILNTDTDRIAHLLSDKEEAQKHDKKPK